LSSIEETSRGALREMRALLAVLRTGDAMTRDAMTGGPGAGRPDPGLNPAPGLGDLGDLARRTAEAGVQVEVELRGEPGRLPAGLDLAAYRVIQEAVTNVIKHAGADRCAVTVDCQPDSLTLRIADDGPRDALRAVVTPPAAGHGIAGMRERVTMYGGEFAAGPAPGRGFLVTAVFPVRDGAW
jgi:signal transduction histidine kinase